MKNEVAYLSSDKNYTVFRAGNKRLKFLAPYSLQYYTQVKEWDNGYIVVMAKYEHEENPIEEYIDLVPILKNLCIDVKSFLNSISNVKVQYDRS